MSCSDCEGACNVGDSPCDRRVTVCDHHYEHLRSLACRALVHCPRDLAEALAKACEVPMPESYSEPPNALAAWAKEGDLREEILEAWEKAALPAWWIKRDGT